MVLKTSAEPGEVQCLAAYIVTILGRETVVTGAFLVWLGVHGRYRCHRKEEAGPESDEGITKEGISAAFGWFVNRESWGKLGSW